MNYQRLLAKSARIYDPPFPAQTIRKHTLEVIKAADRLVEVTGEAQLQALGLPTSWLDRFRREIRVAALMHDLGKSNDHFQGMIQGQRGRDRPQGLRHEAVSFLIAQHDEIREWIAPALAEPNSVDLVLWTLAGHHRKFPPTAAPEGAGVVMRVYLTHEDFRKALQLGSRELGLGEPPSFVDDWMLKLVSLADDSVFRQFRKAQGNADKIMRSLSDLERRYLALLKACLICADVAGSIGTRDGRPIVEWMLEAFGKVPTADDLMRVVRAKLKDRQEPYPFQNQVASRKERVVFVKAGCGTGKTLAAYLWAARRAERTGETRRLFFCYPTTGTATEGYRDYLKDSSLEADLVHGRAEVDKRILDLFRSQVTDDMAPVGQFGEDEVDRYESLGPGGRRGGAAEDAGDALEQWSTPLVSCTVDTVLGLVQNNRRGLYAWPSIARSAFVFDEIHAYDDKLFAALERFLKDVPGVPCLLMTASLPDDRLRRLKEAIQGTEQTRLDPVPGPEDLERLPRYRQQTGDLNDTWERVGEVHAGGGKILWVVNTVDRAMTLAMDRTASDLGALLYHSRFRYCDRVKRHAAAIDAFKEKKAALAITTQVAEMSLDLSADLLVTELAPIPALIQRFGRLNRRAKPQDDGTPDTPPRPFIVLEPDGPLPYRVDQLDEAREWLKELGDGELSQADLVDPKKWKQPVSPPSVFEHQFIWLEGGFTTEPRPLREASPGIDVILRADRDRLEVDRDLRPEAVRIPMPPVPASLDWRHWEQYAFSRVPPDDCIVYDPERGGRWNTA